MMLNGPEDQLYTRSLFRDMRSGEARFGPRIALSFVSAIVLVALMVLVMGIIDNGWTSTVTYTDSRGAMRSYTRGGLQDEHAAIVVFVTIAAWLFALKKVWDGYGRFRRVIRTLLGALAIWSVIVPLCIIIDAAVGRGEEWFIAAAILAGAALTALHISVNIYRFAGGRPIKSPDGVINVNCPHCGYSLMGLREARCPECGSEFTIDELIARQHYAGVRKEPVESEVGQF